MPDWLNTKDLRLDNLPLAFTLLLLFRPNLHLKQPLHCLFGSQVDSWRVPFDVFFCKHILVRTVSFDFTLLHCRQLLLLYLYISMHVYFQWHLDIFHVIILHLSFGNRSAFYVEYADHSLSSLGPKCLWFFWALVLRYEAALHLEMIQKPRNKQISIIIKEK